MFNAIRNAFAIFGAVVFTGTVVSLVQERRQIREAEWDVWVAAMDGAIEKQRLIAEDQ